MHEHLKAWMRIVSAHFPGLSIPQVRGLATWSFGMMVAKSSSLSRVSYIIAQLNEEKENTVRQRLKEWYQEAGAKNGQHRQSLEVSSCFGDLLAWVMALMPAEEHKLSLGMDASNIGQRFTVLSLSVLYGGCAVPVAWVVVEGQRPGSWQPHWQGLFTQLRGVVPADWSVIVCADRGLYADWLYQCIVDIGWHPFLRINHQGFWRYEPTADWQPLTQVVCRPGERFANVVQCFKGQTLQATLLGRWDQGYKDPWLILTDYPPAQAEALWYGLRAWVECSYRDVKSDGWQWHRTRLSDPKRAERIWFAMAVAMLAVITCGSQTEAQQSATAAAPLTAPLPKRKLSLFTQGCLALLVALIQAVPITLTSWLAQPWPHDPDSPILDSG